MIKINPTTYKIQGSEVTNLKKFFQSTNVKSVPYTAVLIY